AQAFLEVRWPLEKVPLVEPAVDVAEVDRVVRPEVRRAQVLEVRDGRVELEWRDGGISFAVLNVPPRSRRPAAPAPRPPAPALRSPRHRSPGGSARPAGRAVLRGGFAPGVSALPRRPRGTRRPRPRGSAGGSGTSAPP